jgi:hypothetical protein
VEFTMRDREAARGAEYWDLIQLATKGLFPGPVLEALIARLEAGK